LESFLAPLSGVVAKLAGIDLLKFGSFSYWFDNLGFTTEERLPAVLIITFSWGFPTGRLYIKLLHQHRTTNKFSGAVAGEKEDFCKGSLSLPTFYLVIVLLILFLLASFYQKYKKNSSFIVVIFTCLLLVLLEWVLLRTPSCVILLAPKTIILSALLLRHLLLRQIFMRLNLFC
jgi:hypothetical protein